MEGCWKRPRRGTVYEKFGGYKAEVKERIEERERHALRNKVKEEKHIPGTYVLGVAQDIF